MLNFAREWHTPEYSSTRWYGSVIFDNSLGKLTLNPKTTSVPFYYYYSRFVAPPFWLQDVLMVIAVTMYRPKTTLLL